MSNRTNYLIRSFNEDLDGVTKIQREFIVNNAKFIYFRKGEAENNIIIAFLVAAIVFVYKFVKDYPQLKKGARVLLDDVIKIGKICVLKMKSWSRGGLPDVREIARPKNKEVTITLEILRRIGVGVRYLTEERRGQFRYFVNNKQYCLFIRRSDDSFSGILGNDPDMISSLKEAFEIEWKELGHIQKDILPTIPGIEEAQRWDR